MTPTEAGEYDRYLGQLLQRGALRPSEFTVLNRLFWSLRSRGSDRTQATIDLIVMRTGLCRETVVGAIDKGIALGVVQRIHTTIRRAIGSLVQWVRGANIYVFCLAKSEPSTTLLKARLDNPLTVSAGAGAREEDEEEAAQDGESAPAPEAPAEKAPPVSAAEWLAGLPAGVAQALRRLGVAMGRIAEEAGSHVAAHLVDDKLEHGLHPGHPLGHGTQRPDPLLVVGLKDDEALLDGSDGGALDGLGRHPAPDPTG